MSLRSNDSSRPRRASLYIPPYDTPTPGPHYPHPALEQLADALNDFHEALNRAGQILHRRKEIQRDDIREMRIVMEDAYAQVEKAEMRLAAVGIGGLSAEER